MRDLIDFALQLQEVEGSRSAAVEGAHRLTKEGLDFIESQSDVSTVLRQQAQDLGLVDSDGAPVPGRCAELLLVCDIIARIPPQPLPPASSHPLVYTVPDEARTILKPRQRIDILVERIIRMSKCSLHIGGPFWNEQGFDRLLPVLRPAVNARGVTCHFYIHGWKDPSRVELITNRIREMRPPEKVNTLWYMGPAASLMHAKFVVSDVHEGYLGTANLTSLGLGHHIEVGMELSPAHCKELIKMLSKLVEVGLFSETPPS